MEHAQRERGFFVPQTLFCLNPYFNGTCSKSAFHKLLVANDLLVLILILMEHAQRVLYTSLKQGGGRVVLILILMEHAQRALQNCERILG